MAIKALPALVLLVLVCGELVIAGNAQALLGGDPRTWSPAGPQPPAYTKTPPGYDETGRLRVRAVEEEKAFMMHSLPPHDPARPVPVPPTAN